MGPEVQLGSCADVSGALSGHAGSERRSKRHPRTTVSDQEDEKNSGKETKKETPGGREHANNDRSKCGMRTTRRKALLGRGSKHLFQMLL